jgi:hypothetical protein
MHQMNYRFDLLVVPLFSSSLFFGPWFYLNSLSLQLNFHVFIACVRMDES